jgi:hypothetical protein
VDPTATHAIYEDHDATSYQQQVLGNEKQMVLTDPKNPTNKVLRLTMKAMPIPMEWPMSFYTYVIIILCNCLSVCLEPFRFNFNF